MLDFCCFLLIFVVLPCNVTLGRDSNNGFNDSILICFLLYLLIYIIQTITITIIIIAINPQIIISRAAVGLINTVKKKTRN